MPVLKFPMQCSPMEGKFRSVLEEKQSINISFSKTINEKRAQ